MFHSFTCQYEIPLEEAAKKMNPQIFGTGIYGTELLHQYDTISSDGKMAKTFIFQRGELNRAANVIVITMDNFQQETSVHVSLCEAGIMFSYEKKLRETLDYCMVGKLPDREEEMAGYTEAQKYLHKIKNKMEDVFYVKTNLEEQMEEDKKKLEAEYPSMSNKFFEKKSTTEQNPINLMIDKIKLSDKERQKRRDWKKKGL